ncbi:MAG: hypothetical protein P1V97_32475, partial [Planctomycetota bacterium]|nr:hypothetical protein [Planctomycetota bacterium]
MRKATVFLALGSCLFLSACGARSRVGSEKEPIPIGGGNMDRISGPVDGASEFKPARPHDDVKNQEANSSMGAGRPRGKGGIQGGAFSETHQTKASRDDQILLPDTYGSV